MTADANDGVEGFLGRITLALQRVAADPASAAAVRRIGLRVRFELKGDAGSFLLETTEGNPRISRASARDTAETDAPDLVVMTSVDTLDGILTGRVSPMPAILLGRLRWKGNPARAAGLGPLLGQLQRAYRDGR